MADIRPFRAYRPRPELAARVASPPYDVLDTEEARELARKEPLSFLRVTKPEIELPRGTDPRAPEVYAKGAERLRMLIEEGVLVRDPAPCFYVYQQQMGAHVQVGLVAGASVGEYDCGKIRRHEFTRPDKEDDRTRHMEVLDANPGPVFLTYKHRDEIDAQLASVLEGMPVYDFIASDGVRHALWVVAGEKVIGAIHKEFAHLEVLYIADGHHRAAAASRVAAGRRGANRQDGGGEEYEHFLSVLIPDDQVKILAYNRVISDLGGLGREAIIERMRGSFEVEPTAEPEPSQPHQFGMCLGGKWFRLVARAGSFPAEDPVDSLDVAILQNKLLTPLLGIGDPRSDRRIDFVGGVRGIQELERRVARGAAVAFALYPTSIAQLIAVADAGKVMPPKSTWFEPKLRSGLIVRPLSDRLEGE